jgi:CRISPR-associated protein Csm2
VDEIKIKFWEEKEKKLVPKELFSQIAENVAKKIAEDGKNNKGKNKGSQLRKYYDESLRLYADIKTKRTPIAQKERFEQILPYIKMLNAKVTYALGRNFVTESYQKLIQQCLSQVNDLDDFEVFISFFESFMAFYKQCGPKEG